MCYIAWPHNTSKSMKKATSSSSSNSTPKNKNLTLTTKPASTKNIRDVIAGDIQLFTARLKEARAEKTQIDSTANKLTQKSLKERYIENWALNPEDNITRLEHFISSLDRVHKAKRKSPTFFRRLFPIIYNLDRYPLTKDAQVSAPYKALLPGTPYELELQIFQKISDIHSLANQLNTDLHIIDRIEYTKGIQDRITSLLSSMDSIPTDKKTLDKIPPDPKLAFWKNTLIREANKQIKEGKPYEALRSSLDALLNEELGSEQYILVAAHLKKTLNSIPESVVQEQAIPLMIQKDLSETKTALSILYQKEQSVPKTDKDEKTLHTFLAIEDALSRLKNTYQGSVNFNRICAEVILLMRTHKTVQSKAANYELLLPQDPLTQVEFSFFNLVTVLALDSAKYTKAKAENNTSKKIKYIKRELELLSQLDLKTAQALKNLPANVDPKFPENKNQPGRVLFKNAFEEWSKGLYINAFRSLLEGTCCQSVQSVEYYQGLHMLRSFIKEYKHHLETTLNILQHQT